MRESGRLFEFDRFATAEDESLAFSAADIVWVGYPRFYFPSSVQGKACRAGRPVIACREGNLGWTTSRYKFGIAVDTSDPAAVTGALLELVNGRQAVWDLYREAGLRYACGRSSREFGDAVMSMIEESSAKVESMAIAAGDKS